MVIIAAVEEGIVSFYDGFDAGFKLYGMLVEDLFGTEGGSEGRGGICMLIGIFCEVGSSLFFCGMIVRGRPGG